MRTIYASLIYVVFAMAMAVADKPFHSQGFFPCTEPDPPFDSSTCNQFTQYAAFVDLIGGGESVQVIKLVGNSATPLINLEQFENGTIACPPGYGCTFMNSDSETKITVVRSPLPPSVPQVLPGDDVSIGFYWRLTRNNNFSPDNRLPYAYQVANCSGDAPYSTCSRLMDEVQYVEYNPFDVDDTLDIQETGCGAECFGDDIDLLGTCGDMVPPPNGWLSDSDGKCSEICCNSLHSIKVRQLGPFCYMFSAQGPPRIAVDFAVTIQNDAIGPDPIVIPVYGMSDPQSLFVNETGVRVRILSIIGDLERFDNANAFSVVHGSIVMCVNQTESVDGVPGQPIYPNEVDGPVDDVADMKWFYMPSTYLPFYRDATSAEASQIIKPNSPADTEHQKVYGEGGSTVERAAVEYLNVNFDTMDAIDMCVDLSGVLPFVPGYDTDEPLTPLSPYETPSNCWMWNAAREGNAGFLPPTFNISSPNWYVRRGIPSAEQRTATYDPNDLYLIYLPTLEQIEQADATDALSNAMLLSVEINDNIMAYDSIVKVPADIASSPPATCGMPLPQDGDGNTGAGNLWFVIESTLDSPLEPGTQIAPVVVEVQCSVAPGVPGLLMISPTGPVDHTIDYTDKKSITYSINITYSSPYEDVAIQGKPLGQCTIFLSNVDGPPDQVGPIQCRVGTEQFPEDDDDDCSFCDLSCKHDQGTSYASMGCFWIYIVVGIILLAVLGVVIWSIVRSKQGHEEHKQALNDDRKKSELRQLLNADAQMKAIDAAKQIGASQGQMIAAAASNSAQSPLVIAPPIAK
jgi:hypothetical protein